MVETKQNATKIKLNTFRTKFNISTANQYWMDNLATELIILTAKFNISECKLPTTEFKVTTCGTKLDISN